MTMADEIAAERAFILAVEGKSRDEYPQPNYTSAEYAEKVGCTEGAAYGRLYRAWRKGVLGSGVVFGNMRVFFTCPSPQ